MANYHPNDELLMQFAAGQAPDALGLMVACHLESCAHCREKVKLYEQLGGDIVGELEPLPVSEGLLDSIMDQLDGQPVEKTMADKASNDLLIPRPLQRFVTSNFDSLEWKGMSSSIKEYVLPFSDETYTAKFYRIKAGKELPEHSHRGHEYTLVMEGSFCDKAGDYHAGDFILADTQTIHRPKAHAEQDCICFAVMDAPLKMTGFFGRMLNPFLR